MYAITFFQGMVFYAPIATLYRQAAGISIFQITVIESVSLAVCLLLELPWGVVADRIGYKNTMIFCCALFFVSKLVFWRAETFWAFLLERVMLSVVIAGTSGVDTAILYLSCEEGTSQKTFGIYNNLGTAGLLFASLVYSVLIGSDYRLAGLLTVVSYGAAAVLSLLLTEVGKEDGAPKTGRAEFFSVLKQTAGDGRFLLFLAGVALLNETHQTVTVFLNQLQYERCGLSASAIGYVYIGVTVAGMAGGFSERLTRRFGEMPFASVLYGVSVAACAVLASVGIAWLSVAAVALLHVCFSLFQPLQTELQNKRVASRNRATELSINALLIDCMGIGTNLMFGKLADFSLPAALLAGAALCTAGFFCVFAWIKGNASRPGKRKT